MIKIDSTLALCCLIFSWGCGSVESPEQNADSFFQVSGRQLLKEGSPMTLQGTNIANWAIWDSGRDPYDWYATENDYANLASWGANAVRLSLSHEWFYVGGSLSSDSVGIQYIDEHLAWAKAYGISLILDLHIPPGGDQAYTPNEESQKIWEEESLQDQFVELWVFIAGWYRSETAIVGYGLMNEPATTDEKYIPLVERALEAIRAEDENHIIFVMQSMDYKFNKVFDDANIVYEFHFYEPGLFTHQGIDWSPEFIDPADEFSYPGIVEEVYYDKAKLKELFGEQLSTPNDENVAFLLGEFAATVHTDETSRFQYYRDVYEIAQELEIPIILNWEFRESEFGFYDWDESAASEDGTGYETSQTDQVTPYDDFIQLFQELW